jgi:hypothetical protein
MHPLFTRIYIRFCAIVQGTILATHTSHMRQLLKHESSTLTPSMITLQPSCMHDTANEWTSKPMSHQQVMLMSCRTQPKKQRSMSLKIRLPCCARERHILWSVGAYMACSCQWGPESNWLSQSLLATYALNPMRPCLVYKPHFMRVIERKHSCHSNNLFTQEPYAHQYSALIYFFGRLGYLHASSW